MATVLVFVTCVALLSTAPRAGAQDAPDITIDVIEVSGLIDPIAVASITGRIADAEASGALALIVQLNSTGATISPDEMGELLQRMRDADLLVAVWVGQSGSKATGGATFLLQAADLVGVSPGSEVGDVESEYLPLVPDDERGLYEALVGERAEDIGAIQAGVADVFAPLLGDMIIEIDAQVPETLAEIDDPDADIPQQRLVDGVQVRLQKLSLVDQLFHTVASPAVAYLLLLIGLSMILLDFYTAGIGVAGVTGAICLLLSSYGLGVLSFRTWALVLLVLAMFAFAIDVQTGVPRFWTGAGTVMLVVGSLFLWDDHGMSWIPLLTGIGLTVAFVLSGMPALVRTRFSTTTIGREWMIGEMGTALTDIDPDGTVEVRGAKWRARTNRLTPLEAGVPARVIAIEGTILEVEPETGGAIDYREMRNKD